jgi:hypothetical protein
MKGADMALPAAAVPDITHEPGQQPETPAKSEAGPKLTPDVKAASDRTPRPQVAASQGTGETPTARREMRETKKRASKADGSTPVTRFFLTKAGDNAKPELDRELQNENEAMIEALRESVSYLALTEWRPTVDNSTPGRPVIEKEAVSRSK